MKKLLFSIIAILGFVGFAKADDTYAHDASVLPKAAQTTIANNFKAKVSVVKIDKDFGRISEYETILTDGTEISFDRDGNWENVEVNNMHSVPAGFIPKEIRAYVNSNHKGMRIVGIDKERSGYDVELSNGIEMKFDKTGKFLRYDDWFTLITKNIRGRDNVAVPYVFSGFNYKEISLDYLEVE